MYKYVTSILTYDVAFKVEPEKCMFYALIYVLNIIIKFSEWALNNCRLQQQSNVVDVHVLVTIYVYQEQKDSNYCINQIKKGSRQIGLKYINSNMYLFIISVLTHTLPFFNLCIFFLSKSRSRSKKIYSSRSRSSSKKIYLS